MYLTVLPILTFPRKINVLFTLPTIGLVVDMKDNNVYVSH